MKNISTILSLAFIMVVIGTMMLLQSCSQPAENKPTQKNTAQIEVPALLRKNSRIGNPIEQQSILTTYNDLKSTIRKNQGDLKSRLMLVQVFMQEARLTGEHGYYYPAALKMIDGVLAEKTKNRDFHFLALSLKATVLLSLHQFGEALSVGQQALKLNDHNAYIYGVLVDANVELGNYQEAVKMSDKMVSIRPDLRSYSRISYLREIHGDVEGAIEAMKMAISAGYPSYEETAWCRLTLGKIHETYGDMDNAEMQYTLALEHRPDYPFAIAALADLDMKKGNYEEAENKLKKACELIPEVSFYEQLIKLYKETGREEQAEKTLKEVFDMLADDEKHGHMMNMEYAQIHLHITHDYDKALEYALQEYEARPDNIDVNKLLAAIYLQQENYDKAEEQVAKALVTNSSDPEFLSIADDIKSKTKLAGAI